MDVFILVAYYEDEGGKPDVLNVYESDFEANDALDMIQKTFPSKAVEVLPSRLVFKDPVKVDS